MKSQFSMDESFTLGDMIRLLLHSSFGQQVSNTFFTFIQLSLSISHFCPCLYYICPVQKVHINYLVQNKSKWAQTSYFYVFCCFMFSCVFFLSFRRNPLTSVEINISQTQEGKKYLDLFVWDSTIAMSEGEKMETAMLLLPVHRTAHLTFSNGVCHFSQQAL